MYKTLLIAIVVLTIGGGSLFAQRSPASIDAEQTRCLAKNKATMPRAKCYTDAFNAWESDIVATYSALQKAVPADERTALDAAQDAWTKYRDAEFHFVGMRYAKKRGTGYISVRITVRIEVVRERAMDLHDLLKAFSPG